MIQSNTYSLFIQVLNVLNAALESNRDSPEFGPLLAETSSPGRSRDFGVAVYRDNPDEPYDYFTIRLKQGTFILVAHGKTRNAIVWRVSEAFLRDVASHPFQYYRQPDSLNLEWLRERAGSGI